MTDVKIKIWYWNFQDGWGSIESNSQSGSNTKTMLSVLFETEGLAHHKYAPRSQTITKEYYTQSSQAEQFWRRKWKQLWASGNWHFRHDNTLAHSLQLVQNFLAKQQMTQVT